MCLFAMNLRDDITLNFVCQSSLYYSVTWWLICVGNDKGGKKLRNLENNQVERIGSLEF